MKKIVFALLGIAHAALDEQTSNRLAEIALAAIDKPEATLQDLAQAGFILNRLGRVDNRLKDRACQKLPEVDSTPKSLHFASQLDTFFGCPSLQDSLKQAPALLQKQTSYYSVEDWFYGQ